MNDSEPPSPIPPDRLADREEVCRLLMEASGTPNCSSAPAGVRRLQEELGEKYGELRIAVDLIREARDQE